MIIILFSLFFLPQHPPPQIFLFLTSEWRSLTAPDCIGGEFSSLIERARSGQIVLVTPSHWSQQAFIKHDIHTSVVLPHGVDTSVMRPGACRCEIQINAVHVAFTHLYFHSFFLNRVYEC
jgi:hypothetical protein